MGCAFMLSDWKISVSVSVFFGFNFYIWKKYFRNGNINNRILFTPAHCEALQR